MTRNSKKSELINLAKQAEQARVRGPAGWRIELLIEQIHPWSNLAVRQAIDWDAKNDDALLDHFEQMPVDWSISPVYEEKRQLVFERLGLESRLSIPERDVMREILKGYLQDRIRIQSSPKATIRREYLNALNDQFRRDQKKRRQRDPLDVGPPDDVESWLSKLRWSRQEFVALLLNADPATFPHDEIELARPFSLIANKAHRIEIKLEGAIRANRLMFPESREKLIVWAKQSGLKQPEWLLPNEADLLPGSGGRLANASLQRIGDVVIEYGKEHDLHFYKKKLFSLVKECIGQKVVADLHLNKQLWKRLPVENQAPGRPGSEADHVWLHHRPRLKAAMLKLKI